MKRICIIEDDLTLAEELQKMLSGAGYEAWIGKPCAEEILNSRPDLVLLDINLPSVNGENILRQMRKASDIPVIMVTSRNTEADEVVCLSYGADDYITKPYNPTVLLLHIEALFRRLDKTGTTVTYQGIHADLQKGELRKGNAVIVLSKNEMIIFDFLLKNTDKIVSRDELISRLWDSDEYVDDNTLTVNISRLRAKLAQLGATEAIITRRGIGYQLQ